MLPRGKINLMIAHRDTNFEVVKQPYKSRRVTRRGENFEVECVESMRMSEMDVDVGCELRRCRLIRLSSPSMEVSERYVAREVGRLNACGW